MIDLAKLKELGAVTVGDYLIYNRDYRVGQGWGQYPEVFSKHYFRADGLEVAYYQPIMDILHVLDTPRQWADSFKKELRVVDLDLTNIN